MLYIWTCEIGFVMEQIFSAVELFTVLDGETSLEVNRLKDGDYTFTIDDPYHTVSIELAEHQVKALRDALEAEIAEA